MKTKINQWSVLAEDNSAPKDNRKFLQGCIRSDTGYRYIVTSDIVDAVGRTIKTLSGSEYVLGKIDPKYRRYIKKIKTDWNWKNPIEKIIYKEN